MADDIKVKLGIDVGNLFANLDKVVSKLAEVAGYADKAEKEIGQIDDQKIDIDTAPAKQSLDTLSKDAEGFGSKLKESFSGANLGAGLVGGLAGGLASAGIGTAVQGIQSLGKAIFDGAVRADEFGDKLEVAFKQQGVQDIQGEIEKVRKSSLGLANDLGMPVERTRELAGTVAQLGGVTGKQAEDLTKLSAGIETFTDGTVKGEAVAKAFSRGLADPEGAAAIEALSKKYPQLAETLKSNLDPTEKLAAANKILGTSFETVAAQQNDAGGTFNKLSNAVSEAFEAIGSTINDVINTLIPIFTQTLAPTFTKLSETLGGVFERIWSVAQPILALLGGAIVAGIVMTINNVLVVIDILYNLWTTAFDAIIKAFKPLVDVIKEAFGSGGALDEGQDLVGTFTEVLSTVTTIMSEVGDVVAQVGGALIEYLITPVTWLIGGIADLVKVIGDWIGANDDNVKSLDLTALSGEKSKGVIDLLRSAFDNIRGTIAGVSEAFKVVKTVIGDFFDSIKSGNIQGAISAFTGFGEKVAEGYNKGFNNKVKDIEGQRFAEQQAEAIRKAQEAQNKLDEENEKKKKKKTTKDEKPKGGAPKVETELDKTLEAYNAFSDKLATQREADVQAEKKRLNLSVDETSAYRQKRLLEDTAKSQEYLNKLFAGVETQDFQADLKIKANLKEGEIQTDVIKKYQDIFTKNQATLEKSSEVKIKINIPAFKDELKEVDNAIKEYTTTADKLVPINFTTDSAEIAKVQQDVLNFQEFLKSENDRIRLLQQEAQIAGNEEAAQKFSEAINKNIQSINTLDNRVKTFAEKSKEEQKKNTLEYQIATALQTSLLDAFNADKIRKEKETNDAIRKERLDSLDAEENDLNKSLAKREISAEEYAAKLADINKGREEAESKTNKSALDNLKKVGEQTAASVLKSQGDIFKKNAEKMEGNEKVFNEFVGNTLNQFSVLAASGTATLADFGKAAAAAAFDAVAAMIPSFVTGILGSSITTLGPILGPLAAASLTGVLYSLLGLARSAAGFKDGVVGLHGEGTETSDSIPAWLSKGESVITARATRNNREELEFMNRTGLSIAEFYKMKMPSTSVSITPEGDLIREVRKLREETRGLGVRIQRNTSVEVSGVLTADSKSINALIVEQKRRTARRG